jgi:GT2 family glycosyltransferase
MSRPAVDVVVPFVGPTQALEKLASRLGHLKLGPEDSAIIVDNSPRPEPTPNEAVNGISVIHAAERSTPGFARNRGAFSGSATWIVFFDADTEPSEDLLERYFDPYPEPRTALVAGGVRDKPEAKGGLPAARYAYIREAMSQENTFRFGAWSYPTTSNVAVRRAAFEAIGGFREDIRAAEDADLTFRLKRAGWEVERRESANVTHDSRRTLWSFVVQKALHGAGGAWLNREYPGCLPARRRPGLTWWALRTGARGLTGAVRSRDRDQALWAVFYPLELLVWELGRSLPNERPLTLRVWRQTLRNLIPAPGTPRI